MAKTEFPDREASDARNTSSPSQRGEAGVVAGYFSENRNDAQYDNLRRAISYMGAHGGRLVHAINSHDNPKQLCDFLEILFACSQVAKVRALLIMRGIGIDNLKSLLTDEVSVPLLIGMQVNATEFAFQLGWLLSSIGRGGGLLPLLDPTVMRKIDWSILVQSSSNWWLCHDSEPNLKHAMGDETTILVGDCLMVKFVGELVALAFESVATNDSVVVRGNWYAPINDTRVALIQAFDRGVTRMNLASTEWLLLRGLWLTDIVTGNGVSSYCEVDEFEERFRKNHMRDLFLKDVAHFAGTLSTQSSTLVTLGRSSSVMTREAYRAKYMKTDFLAPATAPAN